MAAQYSKQDGCDLLKQTISQEEITTHSIDGILVTFDWFTPRPHFIIIPQPNRVDYFRKHLLSNYPDELLCKVIEAAKLTESFLSTSIPSCIGYTILSFHRGNWISESILGKKFHAHVCVDIERYLKVLTATKFIFDGNLLDYEQCVTDEIGKGTEEYYQPDVKAMKSRTLQQAFKNARSVTEKEPHLAWHPNLARIGFIVSKTSGDFNTAAMLLLLKRMDAFTAKLRLNGPASQEDDITEELLNQMGCHFCVSLTGGKFTVTNIK